MNTNKRSARIAGALFLIAMVTSLAGGIWLETISGGEDYLSTVSANETQVLVGVLLELINCIAVVGIAATLLPILKVQSESLAFGYLGFRVVEATILVVATISPLLLVNLSQEYLAAGAADGSHFQALGTLVMAARAHMAGLWTPIFFSLGALLLYSSLYRSKALPRFISVWGLIAVVLLLAWNLATAFGVSIEAGMIFGLPIILNEILMGFWLIVKGFEPSAIDILSAE
jgi:hypothetical protein